MTQSNTNTGNINTGNINIVVSLNIYPKAEEATGI